jgi:hypothetical protein
MNIQRLKEIETLGVSSEELLEYALIKNDSLIVQEALQEHGLTIQPEQALTFAVRTIPENILTTLLRPHGYQPIPKRKQAKRDKALSH